MFLGCRLEFARVIFEDFLKIARLSPDMLVQSENRQNLGSLKYSCQGLNASIV